MPSAWGLLHTWLVTGKVSGVGGPAPLLWFLSSVEHMEPFSSVPGTGPGSVPPDRTESPQGGHPFKLSALIGSGENLFYHCSDLALNYQPLPWTERVGFCSYFPAFLLALASFGVCSSFYSFMVFKLENCSDPFKRKRIFKDCQYCLKWFLLLKWV